MGIANRRQVHLENDRLRVTLLPGGGHIAAVELKETGVNPLWDPPWETIDPSAYDPDAHPQYGEGFEARLLSGIAGHNLCFDIFGVPSAEEAAAGLGVHGEGSSADWEVGSGEGWVKLSAEFPLAGMRFERQLKIAAGSGRVDISETATNLAGIDRPVGWTQHATLGPPFLEKGKTLFEMSATRSKVLEGEFAPGADRFVAGAEFDWPLAPLAAGGLGDMRRAVEDDVSGAYTAHLMDPEQEEAFFAAYHPGSATLFGYVWKRSDFPWLGIWEENFSRTHKPWNGRTLTCGMEFGASPFPETRWEALQRGRLFAEKTIGWVPARSSVRVDYALFMARAAADEIRGFGSGLGLAELRRFASGRF
ncbi:MAG: hypothetical protein OXJ37_02920 [Bryobacterales bacterium]|nr:hypothetical protein [Bryobacterales bacterium]MDE0261338.1 hypothetical protein [Bryobacterales bacterium]MDE0622390.1 hypothetical protein [Bryobacterales bacterium]